MAVWHGAAMRGASHAQAAPRSSNALMREKQNLTKKLQKQKRAADRAS